MGKVLVLVRLLPEDVETTPETLLERVKEKLPEIYEVLRHQAEPIAFGLQALRMIIAMPEEYIGGTNELEEILSQVQGVSQVDVLNVSRAL
ncbi:MAG: elongation factor 1-beta [Thermofilum sp. ex4484_79]|nr:MAG: elongation factor 1-beta [Thermofilum sp. ex4484_79]